MSLEIARSVQQTVEQSLAEEKAGREEEMNAQAVAKEGDLASFVTANLSKIPTEVLRRHLMDRERHEAAANGEVEVLGVVGRMP